ncbi:hypothetical protein JCM10207_000043 [Rhodosporidiobolus poonsookiae]
MTVDRSGIKQLLALRDELNGAIDAISASTAPFPSLDSAWTGMLPPDPNVMMATSAAKELLALLHGEGGVLERAMSYHIPSCMRVAIEAHVTETLREAAAAGKPALHIEEIAKSSIINPVKLARILRVLAAYHMFREVEPDTFANNRLSAVFDTGKSVEELKSTKDFYSGSSGLPALIAHCADDAMKCSSYLADTLFDEKTADSYAPAEGACSRAFNINVPIWEYWAQPGMEQYMVRFGSAMLGANVVQGGGSLLDGFPFDKLGEGATLVDVGSGAGAVSLQLAKAVPSLKLVLQDRKEVVEGPGRALWEKEFPDKLSSGSVQLVAHNFFEPQPVKGADLYFLRCIIHDWADPESKTILSHLADAAEPSSRLVLIEQTYDYLPPNGRAMAAIPYLSDLQMMCALNAQERTEEQYKKLGAEARWKLKKVWKTGPGGQVDGPFRHYEFELASKQ